MSELTKRSFLNFLASLAKTGGILILTFLLTPVLIRLIGAKDFGAFRVLMEIYSYLSLVEMGLLTAVITCLLPVIRSDNKKEIEEIMAQGSWRFYKVVLWTLFFGLMMVPFLPKLTSWEGDNRIELYITFAILLCTSITIPSNIYRAYLESQNKGYLIHIVIFIQNVIFTLLSVLFAWLGLGLKSQAVGMLISVILGALLLRYLSDVKVNFARRNTEHDVHISKRQKSQVLNELAGKLCWQIDQVVIGALIDTTMVTKVFIGQRVALIMQTQLLSLGQSSWASMSHLYYDEEKKDLFTKRFYELSKIIAFLAVVLLVPVCLLNRAFIILWVGKDQLMETDALIYLAAANAFLHGVLSFWGLIMTVLGKANMITKPFWMQAIVNVIASLIGTHYLGGIGPILGTLISYFVVPFFFYPKLLHKHLSLDYGRLYQTLIFPFLSGVAVVLMVKFSPWELTELSVKEFIFYGFIIFISNLILMFSILFNGEEKKLLIARMVALKSNFLKKRNDL